MSVIVPQTMPVLPARHHKVTRPVSSSRCLVPLHAAVAHLEGELLGGMRHLQTCEGAPDSGACESSILTYRHSNAEGLYCLVLLQEFVQTPATFALQCGTASAESESVYPGWNAICAPWSSADSGWQEVTFTATNCAIRKIMIADLPREELGTGDNRVELVDPTYLMAGLLDGMRITASDDAGPKGLIAEARNCWKGFRRQAISWWTPSGESGASPGGAHIVTSGSWTNPFPNSKTWKHIARKAASEGDRDYIAGAFTFSAPTDPGTVYDWRLRSVTTGDSIGRTGLSNTSGSWDPGASGQDYVNGLAVDNDADDELVFEMRVTSGVGGCYVSRLSAGEEED